MRRICCKLLLALMVRVGAIPYILLKNKAPKCFQVEARSRTTMLITYHAPDLVIIEDHDATASEEVTKERKLEDGPDTFYNERFQQRMEALKKAVRLIDNFDSLWHSCLVSNVCNVSAPERYKHFCNSEGFHGGYDKQSRRRKC
jgi:hypothetical protein